MSISQLLEPNNYHLFVNSIVIEDQFSAIPIGASQALTATTPTLVAFNNALVVGAGYNTGTSTFTASASDNYNFSANVEILIDLTADDHASVTAQLLKNGATLLQQTVVAGPVVIAGGVRSITGNVPLQWYGPLVAGDTVTIKATGTSNSLGNGNITALSALNPGTWFMGHRD